MGCQNNMKILLRKIWAYLKDWKNLLGHTLVGLGIIFVSAVLPIAWWARVLVLIGLIIFNMYRERLFKALLHKINHKKEQE
jgi:small-conductance mechanosensitive channel